MIFYYLMVLHGIAWCCIVLHFIALYRMVSYIVVSNSVTRYCVFGFGAQAVSRKTPIYFIKSPHSLSLIYTSIPLMCSCYVSPADVIQIVNMLDLVRLSRGTTLNLTGSSKK